MGSPLLVGIHVSADREEEAAVQEGFERATHGFSRKDLNALGERDVRDKLNSGDYGHEGLPVFAFVSAWLKDAEFARVASDAAKRDAREEATLAIANDALSSAKEANSIARESSASMRLQVRWAIWAAIIATVAAIIATFKA